MHEEKLRTRSEVLGQETPAHAQPGDDSSTATQSPRRTSSAALRLPHSPPEVKDDVADKVALLLHLVVRDHGHQLVVVLGKVEVPVLPLRQEQGHVLRGEHGTHVSDKHTLCLDAGSKPVTDVVADCSVWTCNHGRATGLLRTAGRPGGCPLAHSAWQLALQEGKTPRAVPLYMVHEHGSQTACSVYVRTCVCLSFKMTPEEGAGT